MALFKAYETFAIKGRGLVLVGWVTEGIIKIDMSLNIPGFPQPLVIKGFEHMLTRDPNAPKLGLFFPSTDPDEIQIWKNLDIKDKTFEVF